jgi:hypothetical protein
MDLQTGRYFTTRDNGNAPKVAILNETAARFYFRNGHALGSTVQFNRQPNAPVYEIVGVIRDSHHADNLRKAPERFVYVPILQSVDRVNRLALAVHGSGDGMLLAGPVRKEILAVRSSLLITNVATMESQVRRVLLTERLVSTISTSFGGLALVLACIGLYGILAYSVTRRTNEIGVRMALGATSGGICWSILREALLLAAIGIAAGIPAILGLGRFTKALIYGVQPFDIPSLIGSVLLLLLFAVVAGLLPARRASKLDPMSALRCE